MHGGAPGSGAPKGNKNAVRHGFYTQEAKKLRAHTRKLLHASYILSDVARRHSERATLDAAIYELSNNDIPLPDDEVDRIVTFYRTLEPAFRRRRISAEKAAKEEQAKRRRKSKK